MSDFKTKGDNPKPTTTTGFRNVHHVQVHDSFTPIRMAPMMSLSMVGHTPMLEMIERPNGIYVRCMGKSTREAIGVSADMVEREFLVPYGNISHYEYASDK